MLLVRPNVKRAILWIIVGIALMSLVGLDVLFALRP